MYFKSIELKGFKSFVEHTKLEFEDGVTAIVGPNGCGKSNIADAMRWVLGEQSAKTLRGSKMEDFIFSGSGTRKPVGFAEVSLTITGLEGSVSAKPYSEYEEISVTRKLYRNGDSDFMINQVPCRLKDIVDLFLDTGVNARALSIIEQGQVTKIINSKPDDRKIFIDEAAGIMKYKARRNASLNKLEAGQQNLLRIQDIIAELERQRNSLNRQAKKAERYQSFRTEIKGHGLIHFASEFQDYSATLLELTDLLEGLKDKETALMAELSARRSELDTLNMKVAGREREATELKERRGKVESTIERNDHHRELLARQITDIGKDKDNAQTEIGQIEQEIVENDALIEERSQALGQLRNTVSDKQANITELRQTSDNAQSELNGLRAGINEGLRAASRMAEQISQNQGKQSSINGRLEMSATRLSGLTEREDKLKAEISSHSEKETELNSGLYNLKSEFEIQRQSEESICQELGQVTEELKLAEEELASVTSEMTKHESRLESLQELERNFEGYGEGVRKLMKLKEDGRSGTESLNGALAEEVRAEPELETALAATFGSKLEALVTSSFDEAVKALEILKVDTLGTASFIATDLELGTGQTVDLPSHPSLVGRASDLFRISQGKLKGAYGLLSATLIASDLAGAIEIWKSAPGSFTVVTKDGDVIDRAGFITGGSKKAGAGIVSRRRIIEELTGKVAELDVKKQAAYDAKTTLLESKRDHETKLEACRTASRKLELEIVGIQNEIRRVEAVSSRDNENLKSLGVERDQIMAERDRLNAELEELTLTVSTLHEERQNIETTNSTIQEQIDRAAAELERLRVELQGKELELASQKGNEQNIELDIKRIEGIKATGLTRLTKLRDSIRDADHKRSEMDESIESLGKETVELAREKDMLNEQVTGINNILEEKMEKARQLQETITGLQKELEEVQPKVSDTSIKKSESELRLENIIERADTEFNIPIEDLQGTDIEQHDMDEVNTRLIFLRGELVRIGDVNLAALEEFEQVNNRWEFLKNQRDDLVNSIATLHKTIESINATTKKMFLDTFEEVSKNFESIFKRLFGGGRAEMKLVQEEGKTEPGVDIIVQPPGKKNQNINLLSAGEKAMTAIAMLFAVFQTKPSPFCLLDEIDAPLDEANIGRFRDLLVEMQDNTQFIIITHSQKTMSFADRLYGVTQEEEGVSKVLAVNLKDDREPAPLAVA